MALSSSTDFNLTARQVIGFALKKLRVIAESETPSAGQAEDAKTELNLMLKGWQKHENLWRLTEGSITLVANDYDYNLSPQPHRVVSARYRDASAIDLPMQLMTREEYFNLPNKTTTGVPTQFYVDYQRAATVFYLWQCPSSVTTETIRYTYQKKFDDIDTLDDDIEVRAEFLECVGYGLATRLGPDYGRVGTPSYNQIKETAIILLEEALDEDREDELRFVPGYGQMGYGSESPW